MLKYLFYVGLVLALILVFPACGPVPENKNPWVGDPEKWRADLDRQAVLISVNDYGDGKTPPLEGPVNDMNGLARLLNQKYGFEKEGVLRLHGPAAGRDGILAALAALEKRAAADRLLVFAFAGHGSILTDTEGNEEPDGKDETICTYDRNMEGGGDIRDDTLHAYYQAILAKGAYLTVLMDACHSGGTAKPGGTFRPRAAGQARPPIKPAKAPVFSSGRMNDTSRFVFLAAAREEERAAEDWFPKGVLPEGIYGLFSHVLQETLLDAPANWSWWDVQRDIENRVQSRNGGQHPHFLGNLRLNPFGDSSVANRPRFRVAESNEGGLIRVDAGLMSGIELGARLAVIPKGQPMPERWGNSDSLYRVTEVSARSVLAERTIPQSGAVPSPDIGDSVIVVIPGSAFRQYRLFIDDPVSTETAGLLSDRIDAWPFLQRALPGDKKAPHDFRLSRTRGGNRFLLEGPIQIDFEREGRSPAELAAIVETYLVRGVNWDRLRGIHNPLPNGFYAEEAVTLTIERGKWDEGLGDFIPTSSARDETGALHVWAGDVLRLSYRNTSTKPLFVTVFWLANDGGIFAWNDYQHASLLQPGAQVLVGDTPIAVGPPFGREMVKVVVSTAQPFDPRPFLQAGGKGVEGGAEVTEGLTDELWGAFEIPILSKPAPKHAL